MDEPMAVSFLQSRGILPETVKRYQIGFDKNWIDPAIVQQAKESASAFHSVSVPAPEPRIMKKWCAGLGACQQLGH